MQPGRTVIGTYKCTLLPGQKCDEGHLFFPKLHKMTDKQDKKRHQLHHFISIGAKKDW